ncbi:MAG: hypothetical protein AB1330_01015 [Bacillota bacterium]
MSEDELSSLCSEWQEILGLQHWAISVSVNRAPDFESTPPSTGRVKWQLDRLLAHIQVLSSLDYNMSSAAEIGLPQDMEQTLVHELVHLLFVASNATRSDGGLEEILFEQGVDQVANALVALRRIQKAKEGE